MEPHKVFDTSLDRSKSEFRVLRCFCGCSELTFEEIERLSMMKVDGIINSNVGKRLLKSFLAVGHRNDKSNVSILLDCFDSCERVLSNISSYDDLLDDLAEVCPSYKWEQRITEATTNPARQTALLELKKECLASIECDVDFHRFRRELLRKIGK